MVLVYKAVMNFTNDLFFISGVKAVEASEVPEQHGRESVFRREQ